MALIMTANAQQLQFIKDSIETIPDYPKEGSYSVILRHYWIIPRHIRQRLIY